MRHTNSEVTITRAGPSGVYPLCATNLPEQKIQAAALGYATTVIDMAGSNNKADALGRIADALVFPDWFGHNWDALGDCLTDMSWTPAPGYLIVFEHLDDLHESAAADFATLLDVLRDAASSQAVCGVPTWFFVGLGKHDGHPHAHTGGYKRPESVLVVIHTSACDILLLERVAPSGFWQSVTGSLEAGETPRQAALREIAEETGIHAQNASLRDWRRSHCFEIRPEWRARYAPDVTHNTEHVFSLCLPHRCAVTLAPDEHVRYAWLKRDAAAARVFSWTNREAILGL